MRWVTQRYVQYRLERTSTHAGYSSFLDVWREFFRHQNEFKIIEPLDVEELKLRIIKLVERAISRARESHRLWALYRPIQWYLWCADNYPELGFCPSYALELEAISIPGNPKGEAVRMEDADRGPLKRTSELNLLIHKMRNDKSKSFDHLQEKAALALSIALGRNPANLTFLKEGDLVNLTPNIGSDTWIVRMPRIKKRQINPRDDLLDEYIDAEFASYVKDLIEANSKLPAEINEKIKRHGVERPIFINLEGNKAAIRSRLVDSFYNMTSEQITGLIQQFVQRHKIISPETKQPLVINTRRLRYTLGTSLAADGISRKELARILDHTDTQHVQVYFELASTVVEHLDRATAKQLSKVINLFKGKIVKDDSEAVNGDRDDKHLKFIDEQNPVDSIEIGVCGEKQICHLDPPFSCYLCEKFQPYSHADHNHVLDCLLKTREERVKKYENARMGVQLDDVIIAVARVAKMCEPGGSDGR